MTTTGMLQAESQSGAAQASMDTDITESPRLMIEGTDMVGMCMVTGILTGPLTDSVVQMQSGNRLSAYCQKMYCVDVRVSNFCPVQMLSVLI